jgi:hypothetical protein
MLRLAVLIFGVLLLAGSAITAGYGVPVAPLWLLVGGGLITVGTLCERVFYKPLLSAKPGAGWVRTEERFIDPHTGKMVDVFYQPASGDRQYVSHGPHRQ